LATVGVLPRRGAAQSPSLPRGQAILARAVYSLCLLLAATWTPAAAPVAFATPAGAITVNTAADTSGGPACSLPDAITAANTNSATGGCPAGAPGLDTISFHLGNGCSVHPCPITLASPLPTIIEDLTINGAGAPVILSGGGATRLLNVVSGVTLRLQQLTLEDAFSNIGDGGAISNHGNLWLENSTIQNSQTDSNHSGGAIFSDGPVTITNSLLRNNQAGSAGALFANFGNAIVSIQDSTLSLNRAVNTGTGYGGAIWVGSLAQLSITGGAILSNTAQSGGGLYLSAGAAVTLTSTGPPALVSGNSATDGGGLYNAGTLTLTNVTLSGNLGSNLGGGIWNFYGLATLTNATLSGNSAGNGGGIDNSYSLATLTNATLSGNSAGIGGGIFNDSGTAVLTDDTLSGDMASNGGGIANWGGAADLTNVTLSGNTASLHGGGLYQRGNYVTETISLSNTLIANGVAGENCARDNSSYNLISAGYNLSSDGTCAAYLNQSGDLNGANTNLGPLANNGGSTLTQMPNPPSPAIDAIPLGVNGCGATLTSDQRGAPRPINGKCDIGALEAGWIYLALWLPFIRR